MKRTGVWVSALVMTAVVALSGCGSKKAPEQTMLGAWELDKEATQQSNPLIAAVPGGISYEFRADGSGAEGIGGPAKPCSWKVVKKEGSTLTIELVRPEDREPSVIEVTVADADHLTVNYPQGLGACQLKRVKAGATRGAGGTAGDSTPTAGPTASLDAGIEGGATAVAVTPDGKTVAVTGHGKAKNVKVFDLAEKKELRAFDNSSGSVLPIALSPDGKLLAYAAYSSIVVYDLEAGKQRHQLRKKDGNLGFPIGLSFSPKGDLLVVGTGKDIVGWDPQSGVQRFSWPGDDKEVTALTFFADGTKLASGGEDGLVKIWDIVAGKIVRTLTTGYKEKVLALAVTRDGATLASAAFMEPVKVWEVATGSARRTVERPDMRVDALLFLPDGKTLVYADREHRIHLLNVDTGAKRRELRGHTKHVWSLALTGDGGTLVSGGEDGTVKVWDVK